MEAAFAQLQKEGKADVDSLVKWMKDSKVIVTPEQEAKVRGHFQSFKGDPKNVSLKEFKEVLGIVAGDMKTNVVRVADMLKTHAPQVLDPKAAIAGVAGAAAGFFGTKAVAGNSSAGTSAPAPAPVKQSDPVSESNEGDPDNPDPYDDHHDGSEHHSGSPTPSEHNSRQSKSD